MRLFQLLACCPSVPSLSVRAVHLDCANQGTIVQSLAISDRVEIPDPVDDSHVSAVGAEE
jgi:hypothetical protein